MRFRYLAAAALGVVFAVPTPALASLSTTTARSATVSRQAGLCEAGSGTTLGTVANPDLKELSGLAQSRAHPRVLWANNDSGDAARIFAMGTDGADHGTVTVAGAAAVDWEDLALGPGPGGDDHLYVGDIGGAGGNRATVVVYRFPEPVPPGAGVIRAVTAHAVNLRYPDGPHDAEALLLDPRTGDLVIVTKVTGSIAAGVYRATGAATARAGSTVALARVGDLGAPSGTDLAQRLARAGGLGDLANSVTAGDASAAGRVALVRTYTGVNAYKWPKSRSLADALLASPCRAPAPTDLLFPQGEAVAVAPNGRNFITASEGVGAPLVQFRAAK